MRLNILEAKNRLSELVRAACAGADVVIAKNGQPMVRLVPVAASGGIKGFGSFESGGTGSRKHRQGFHARRRAQGCPAFPRPRVTLLLDTQVVLWWLVGARRLSGRTRKLLAESACLLSAASVWEVAIAQPRVERLRAVSADKAWRDCELDLAVI